jgi:hypothetical protein
MSDVHVEITWSGTTGTPSQDPVKVKLSHGQDKVKWESTQGFAIGIQGTTIQATHKDSKWEAKSPKLTTPGSIPYTIASASGGPAEDPTIDVET